MKFAAILALIDAAIVLISKVKPALKTLKQSRELTPAQEAQLDERIEKLKTAAHWQV